MTDAEGATELATEIVHGRADTGVTLGHCRHHRVRQRRQAQPGAEADERERDLDLERGAALADAGEEQQRDRHRGGHDQSQDAGSDGVYEP
jgi:hypothetical protein